MSLNNKPVIGIALFGMGNIGSHWLKLFSKQCFLPGDFSTNFRLVSVANSSSVLVESSDLELDILEIGKQFENYAKPYNVASLLSKLSSLNYDNLVILDVTASCELASLYPTIAKYGMHLVTANKYAGSSPTSFYSEVIKAFALSQKLWRANATVGAGLPINSAIQDLIDSGDKVLSISGIFSGTLSWLFEKYDGSIPFSHLVRAALEEGFTEPDPRLDLDGSDVMRKLIILSRIADINIEPEDVKVESLVPYELSELSVEDFFASASSLDRDIKRRFDDAKSRGKLLRYVARLTAAGKANVGIEELDINSPLVNLLPGDNVFVVNSNWYSLNPLVIRGPGAGRDVTAGALQSDLVQISKSLNSLVRL